MTTTDDQPAPDPGWFLAATSAIEQLARTGRTFDAGHVAELLKGAEPSHPNMWGAAFIAAHAAGSIEHAGATVSRRRTGGKSLIRTWRGTPEVIDISTGHAA